MANLILSLDGQVIKEYDINKERMTIGRKPHNDIQIDNLAVSGGGGETTPTSDTRRHLENLGDRDRTLLPLCGSCSGRD